MQTHADFAKNPPQNYLQNYTLLCPFRTHRAIIPPSPCPLFLFFCYLKNSSYHSYLRFAPNDLLQRRLCLSSLRSERSAPEETVLIFASLLTICSQGDCAYLRFAPNDRSQGDCAFREGTAVLEFLHKDRIFIVTCGKNSRYNHFLRELFARFKK